jgi:hypothetical protein
MDGWISLFVGFCVLCLAEALAAAAGNLSSHNISCLNRYRAPNSHVACFAAPLPPLPSPTSRSNSSKLATSTTTTSSNGRKRKRMNRQVSAPVYPSETLEPGEAKLVLVC